ncbi:hypothetical protein BGV40_07940 [Methanosarcina sp. Ant1]|nr:hypothetical protein BGV40_07940 [Methanosarcina sp. Ant1]
MEVETDIPDDPQEKINSMLERLEDTREKMEIEARIFIEATKQFTLEWIRREMEVTILTLESEPSPDNLGSDNEKLSELKSDLKKLPYRIPDIVEAYINRENYWIHRRGQLQAGISVDYLEFKKEKMRRGLTLSIRMILGCAVEIFGDLNDGKPEDKGWVKEQGKRKYVCFLRFSDEMTASLNRYFERLEELFTLNYEIKEKMSKIGWKKI